MAATPRFLQRFLAYRAGVASGGYVAALVVVAAITFVIGVLFIRDTRDHRISTL